MAFNLIMSLHRYHTPQLGGGAYLMHGSGLTRYHTPTVTQRGGGLAEDLLKVAGPAVVNAMQHTLQDVRDGKSLVDTVQDQGKQLAKNLKRKLPSMALAAGKHSARQRYKKAKRRVTDIFS